MQNLVVMLLQGLHLHTGDGVVEPLELIIPGDSTCSTEQGQGTGVSVEGSRAGLNTASGFNKTILAPASKARSSAGAPTQGCSSATSPQHFPQQLPYSHTKKKPFFPVHTQFHTTALPSQPAQPLLEQPRQRLWLSDQNLAQDKTVLRRNTCSSTTESTQWDKREAAPHCTQLCTDYLCLV